MEIIKYKSGTGYVGGKTNKQTRVNSVDKAIKFEAGEAKKFMENYISKSQRNLLEVVGLIVDTDTQKPIMLQKNNIVTMPTVFDSLDFDWSEKIRQDEEFERQFNTYRTNLSMMRSRIDDEINDVLHYIELNKLSASEGYCIYKQLQEKLRKRRTIKDETVITSVIDKERKVNINAENIYKAIRGLESRTYLPRAMPELFNTAK